MRVVIAIDSFKGCMTSLEAGNAAMRGVLRARPADVTVLPAADGGEGTVDALVSGLGGTFRDVWVEGPLGKPVLARYGILPNGSAVMEMAAASGITLVPAGALDPWAASSVGVGQMVLDAVGAGCRDFVIGIGGSATTEGGIGMLSALGWDFLDNEGEVLPPRLASLGRVSSIRAARVPAELGECRFRIACDVTNPLCGASGAVATFGLQKGVPPNEVQLMDGYMETFARVVQSLTGRACSDAPGAGAAGGLGFAFLSFMPHVELAPGAEVVLDAVGLDDALCGADVVITGEGRLDAQTAMGKVPAGVARVAKEHGATVLAFAGDVADGAESCHDVGIDACFPIVRGPSSLEKAMDPQTAQRNMEHAVEQAFRLLSLRC